MTEAYRRLDELGTAAWQAGLLVALMLLVAATPAVAKDAVGLVEDGAAQPKPKEKAEEDEAVVKPTQPPEALIKLLATGDYDERQQALRELEAHGEDARAALEKSLETAEDLEVRNGLLRLLGKLNRSSLEVTVVNRRGKPMPDASATVHLRAGSVNVFFNNNQNQMYTTDKNGRFTIERVEPGPSQAYFQWKDTALAPYASWSNQMFLYPGVNRLRFVAIAPGSLSGLVQDAETGKPVDSANLTLAPVGFEIGDPKTLDQRLQHITAKTSSDEKGAFKFEKAAAERYVLVVQHEKHHPTAVEDVRITEDGKIELDAPVKLNPKPVSLGKLKIEMLGKDGKPFKSQKVGYTLERVEKEESAEARAAREQQLMQWGWNQQATPQGDTDENGVMELDELEPGTYRLTLQINDAPDIVVQEVVIKPKETTELTKLKPAAGATIEGRVLAANVNGMRYAQVWAIDESDPVSPLILSDMNRYNGWLWQRRRNPRGQAEGFAQTDEHGQYKIGNMPPGTYTLAIRDQTGLYTMIHGVKADAGKTVRAPDIEGGRPASAKVAKGAKDQENGMSVRGRVEYPDGSPAPNVIIILTHMQGTWNNNTNQKGEFVFATGNRNWGWNQPAYIPKRLTVNLAGYRPQRVDLTGKGTHIKDLVIRLEKQSFGSLVVTVTDPAGKPLPGATVDLERHTNRHQTHWGMPRAPNLGRKTTNSLGQATIGGLASGKRRIRVELEGYYLEGEAAEAEVKLDETARVTVVLHPGLSIKGKVNLPEGRGVNDVVLVLHELQEHNTLARTASPEADGSYAFTGLKPGGYRLDVQCHDLKLAGADEIELKQSGLDRDLDLVQAGGLKVALGAEYANAHLSINEPGSWKIDLKKPKQSKFYGHHRQMNFGYLVLDADGRGEFYGIAPGVYDLVIYAQQKARRQHNLHNSWGGGGVRGVGGQVIVEGVKIESLAEGIDGLDKLAPLKLDLPPISCELEAELDLRVAEDPKEKQEGDGEGADLQDALSFYQNNSMQVHVHLIGKGAQASHHIYMNRNWNMKQRVRRLGTPPEGVQESEQSGGLTFKNMPPGEYQMYVQLRVYQYKRKFNPAGYWQTVNEPFVPDDLPEPEPIKTVTLKEGETLELGEIPYTVPAWAVKAARENGMVAEEDDEDDLIGQDRMPVFSP